MAVVSRSASQRERRYLALLRFGRNRAAIGGAIVLVLFILMAVFAGEVGRVDPLAVDLTVARTGPSAAHPLGVDLVGRDVWSRLVHASRVSLSVGLGAVAIYTVIGVVLGSIAGYYRGWLDSVILRFTDIVMSFPVILILLVAVSLLGTGLTQLIVILGLLGWPAVARLVRGQFLSLREMEFVLAARAVGASDVRLIVRHLLPNTLGVVVVAGTFGVAAVILIEASLSFLGMGVQPPTPSWGNMLKDAQSLSVLNAMPWLWAPPGLMIFLTILSINFLGDGLRDAFDPHSKPV
ncbi:MAG: oligopeptide ABC transporter permease [Candidatus Limnocylindria bacterium]